MGEREQVDARQTADSLLNGDFRAEVDVGEGQPGVGNPFESRLTAFEPVIDALFPVGVKVRRGYDAVDALRHHQAYHVQRNGKLFRAVVHAW